jgi:peptidoglycan/LPS O-acetylase OafA/YrhL
MSENDAAPVGSKAHLHRLDCLRAFAFLCVYASHVAVHFRAGDVGYVGGWLKPVYSSPFQLLFVPIRFGWIGVAFFFVLSGFCIHYATLHRPERFSIADFYGRRFLRIYPAYIVAMLVYASLHRLLPIPYFNGWNVVAHVFMVHNFLKATIFGIDGPLWSLAVEMQFYLLYPLLLALMRRWGGAERCLILGLALNVGMQLYLEFGKKAGFNPVSVGWCFPLVTWCDWILGVCLAEAYVHRRQLFRWETAWLILSAGMLVAAFAFKILNAQAYLFGSVFFAVVMQRYLRVQTPLRLLERALVPVGVISYSLYLWHQPLLHLVNVWGKRWAFTHYPYGHLAWTFGISTVLTTLIGLASYRFLEVGAPRLIRRFMKRKHLQPPSLPGPAESPLFS